MRIQWSDGWMYLSFASLCTACWYRVTRLQVSSPSHMFGLLYADNIFYAPFVLWFVLHRRERLEGVTAAISTVKTFITYRTISQHWLFRCVCKNVRGSGCGCIVGGGVWSTVTKGPAKIHAPQLLSHLKNSTKSTAHSVKNGQVREVVMLSVTVRKKGRNTE